MSSIANCRASSHNACMSQPIYSPLVRQALEFASIKHQGQYRKNPVEKIPYISHPAAVGLMLARAGYDDEVVAAGVLHDVVEDCGVSLAELSKKFGPRVARLVDQVSEPSKDLAWEVRKQAYRDRLEGAEPNALAIAAADHLHNLQNLLEVYKVAPSVVNMFKTGMAQKHDHEQKCSDIFQSRLGGPLSQEFASALAESGFLTKIN